MKKNNNPPSTVFYDGVTGKELTPEEMQWLEASLDLVRAAASPEEFEQYKTDLMAACLLEERTEP